MIRCLVILFTSGLFFSCAGNKVAGLYGKCPKHYLACTQYLFKSDKEFEYFNFMDVGGVTIIKGNWKQLGDTIILNSYVQPSDRVIEVVESTIDTSTKLSFEFYNESIKRKDAAFIRLNSDTSKAWLLTDDGSINVPNSKLTKLFISPFFDSRGFPIPYTVKNPNSNHFFVRIKNLEQSIFITNEKFLTRGRKIYRLNSGENTHNNIFYEKVKPSQKQY